jgi:fatty acid desaturase
VFPFWKAIIAVPVVSFVSGFYLANVFAPNHKGMPQLKKDVAYSFFEQQVVTSRNVRCGLILDYILLGLNYQVEHHLFPGASRGQMKNLHTLVEKACRENGMPIVEMNIIETNKFILSELKVVAEKAQKEYLQLHAKSFA